MTSTYQPLTKEDNELWQANAKGIEKSVRAAFPSIPSGFQLKPVTFRKTMGCGMFYDFKVALPDGQYANVSFHTGGYPMPSMAGAPEPEQHYNVDPTPSNSKDE